MGWKRKRGGTWRRQKKREGARLRARRVGKIFFGFYALLAKHFSLPIRRVRGREARSSTPKFATVLTVLTIHLFKAEKLSVALERVSQRAFSPRRFFMPISFIFSYSESFSVVFYLWFFSYLATGRSGSTSTFIDPEQFVYSTLGSRRTYAIYHSLSPLLHMDSRMVEFGEIDVTYPAVVENYPIDSGPFCKGVPTVDCLPNRGLFDGLSQVDAEVSLRTPLSPDRRGLPIYVFE